jgi:hypothetical protein
MTTLEKLEELVYRGEKRSQETENRFQELAKHLQESDKRFKEEMKKLSKQFGDFTDTLGRFAESAVFPAVIPLFKKRGIRINSLWGRLPAVHHGQEMELDIAGIGPDCAIAIEVKLRLQQEHVKDFLEKLPKVFEFYPLLKRPILYGGVAAMTIDKDVERFAYKQGLFILTQTGDNVRIVNDRAFRPRSFGSFKKNGAPRQRKR